MKICGSYDGEILVVEARLEKVEANHPFLFRVEIDDEREADLEVVVRSVKDKEFLDGSGRFLLSVVWSSSSHGGPGRWLFERTTRLRVVEENV